MPYRIVAFGELLWDLLPDGRQLGGAPFNFAYRVNSLGDAAYPISRLGRDPLGREARELAGSFGIDACGLQWDDSHPTGTVQVFLDSRHNPDYFIVPSVAYDFIEHTPALEEIVRSSHCFCFGTLIQRSEVSRRTLQRLLQSAGCGLKLLDVNLRRDCFTPEIVRQSLEHADVAKLNEAEAHAVAEIVGLPQLPLADFAGELVERCGLQAVVVTLGEKGALGASPGAGVVYVPGYRVPVVDSLGAGDAFSAGFVHRLLRGASVAEACRFGNVMGALAAARRGGTAPIAPDEMARFADEKAERIADTALSKHRSW